MANVWDKPRSWGRSSPLAHDLYDETVRSRGAIISQGHAQIEDRKQRAEENKRIIAAINNNGTKLEEMKGLSEQQTKRITDELSALGEDLILELRGLGEKIDDMANRIDARLMQLIQTIEYGFAEVTSELIILNQALSEIIETLKNRQRTDAAEQTRTGILLYSKGRFSQAHAHFESANKIFPTAEAYLYLGKITLYEEGNASESENHFEQAIIYGDAIPGDHNYAQKAWLESSLLSFLMRDFEACRKKAISAAQIENEDFNVLIRAARILVAVKDFDTSYSFVCRAFEIEPYSVLVLALPWTDPIKSRLKTWLITTHKKEFEPINGIQTEAIDVHRVARKAALETLAWRNLPKTTSKYDLMKKGFADLRVFRDGFLEGMRSIAASAKEEMEGVVRARRSDLNDFHPQIMNETTSWLFVFSIIVAIITFLVTPLAYPEMGEFANSLGTLGEIFTILWQGLLLLYAGIVGVFILGIALSKGENGAIVGGFWGLIAAGIIPSFLAGWLKTSGAPWPIVLFFGFSFLSAMGVVILSKTISSKRDEMILVRDLNNAEQILEPLITRLNKLANVTIPSLMNAKTKRHLSLAANLPAPLLKIFTTFRRSLFQLNNLRQSK